MIISMIRDMTKIVVPTFLIGLFISSCNEEENEPQTTNSAIVGVWECVSLDYTGTTQTEFLGQSTNADFVGEANNIDFTYTISENPNIATSEGIYDVELTTTLLGITTTQTIENIAFDFVGSWSLSGSQMSVTNDGISQELTIIELTENSLILNILEEDSTTISDVTSITTIDLDIVFSK